MRCLTLVLLIMACRALPAATIKLERVTLADGRTLEGQVSPSTRAGLVTITLYWRGRSMGALDVRADDITARESITQDVPEAPPKPKPGATRSRPRPAVSTPEKDNALLDKMRADLGELMQVVVASNLASVRDALAQPPGVLCAITEAEYLEHTTSPTLRQRARSTIRLLNAGLKTIRAYQKKHQRGYDHFGDIRETNERVGAALRYLKGSAFLRDARGWSPGMYVDLDHLRGHIVQAYRVQELRAVRAP